MATTVSGPAGMFPYRRGPPPPCLAGGPVPARHLGGWTREGEPVETSSGRAIRHHCPVPARCDERRERFTRNVTPAAPHRRLRIQRPSTRPAHLDPGRGRPPPSAPLDRVGGVPGPRRHLGRARRLPTSNARTPGRTSRLRPTTHGTPRHRSVEGITGVLVVAVSGTTSAVSVRVSGPT